MNAARMGATPRSDRSYPSGHASQRSGRIAKSTAPLDRPVFGEFG
jgi:hypothetical protein